MKAKFFSVLMAVALIATQSSVALVNAQGSSTNWSAVQAVGVDERLIVKQKDGKTIEGKMIEANDTNLSLTRNGKVVNISRDSISQILHSRGKAQKGKWAAIGAGIGTATGVGIGAWKNSTVLDDGEIYILAGAIIGAGSGALGGLIYGATRRNRELIYQSN
jgi:predicted aconitase